MAQPQWPQVIGPLKANCSFTLRVFLAPRPSRIAWTLFVFAKVVLLSSGRMHPAIDLLILRQVVVGYNSNAEFRGAGANETRPIGWDAGRGRRSSSRDRLTRRGRLKLCQPIGDLGKRSFQLSLRSLAAKNGVVDPPIHSHLLCLVHRTDHQADLNREQLNIHQLDLDIASDDNAFVQHSLDELKGHPFFDYCDQTGAAGVRMLLSKGASSESSGRIESNLKTKGGCYRAVSWVFSQMMDDAARTVGFVIVGRDLTEQRKFELQILESQKLAALGVMARGIAHEIRSPLAVSSSAAQFLMEDGLTPEFRRECAEKVHSGIRRASTIIENLLRFAHPSADKSKTPLDLLGVIKEALTLVDSQAKVQNIEIRTHFPPAPCQVLGVPSLLEQVFINLLLNAINAMPNGGTVDVVAERAAGELLLRVIDTGEGISREDLDKIFDPFFTKAPLGKGTGLGLSICNSIVEQHGGSISELQILRDGARKGPGVNGFGDVAVATRCQGIRLLRHHRVGRQRHNDHIAQRRLLPQPASQFQAVHSG